MTSIELTCTGARVTAKIQNGILTAGMIGAEFHIAFDDDWNGLTPRLYVSRCDKPPIAVVIDGSGVAKVPHECLIGGHHLVICIDGWSSNGELRIPTMFADCGFVYESADSLVDSAVDPDPEPTPDIIQRITALAYEASRIAQSVRDDADNHVFDGPQGPMGPQGPKGDPFIFSDFTPEQLEDLRGPQGPQGPKGEAFSYEDFTPEQLIALTGPMGPQGPTGPKGERGPQGAAFTYQDFTPAQIRGLIGPKGDPFVYSDFTPEQIAGLKGPQGPKGDPFVYSDFTPEQLEDLKGPKGDPGPEGIADLTVTHDTSGNVKVTWQGGDS